MRQRYVRCLMAASPSTIRNCWAGIGCMRSCHTGCYPKHLRFRLKPATKLQTLVCWVQQGCCYRHQDSTCCIRLVWQVALFNAVSSLDLSFGHRLRG